MPDNINITVNETIENIVINPSISTDVIDVNTYSTTENVTIDVTPNLTTVNINTITGSLITKTSDLINDGEDGINPFITLNDIPVSGLTSVGLTMPVAFNVANSPLTSDGTIAVSAAGTSSQYIRGDGQLATLPTGAGGGSTVAYYLNGSINASVAGYKQLSNLATIGGGTDFTLVGNGLIAQFLTDLGNPNRTEIPGGAWNFEMFFQSSSAGGSAKFYVELLKYDGITFTSIASSVSVPEEITGGTAIDLYLTSLAVPTTTLLVTDRLAIRVYIVDNSGGRTITLHTEDNTLCEIITTFSGGVTSLNGLTANTQYLAVGTTGTDFNISSLVDTHTFNLPTASATNRGVLSSADFTSFNNKFTLPSLTAGSVLFSNGTTIAQDNANLFWDDTNNRLNLGGIISNTARLGIRAPGALSTDIALRVRNSADTGDLMTVNGLGGLNVTSSIGAANDKPISVSGSTGDLFYVRGYGDAFLKAGLYLGAINGPNFITDGRLGIRSSQGTGTAFITFTHNNGNTAFKALSNSVIELNPVAGNVLIGTTTNIASSKLTIESTTQGFLPPRMTNAQRIAIATPAVGLCVYCTDVVEGLYINKSTGWTFIG